MSCATFSSHAILDTVTELRICDCSTPARSMQWLIYKTNIKHAEAANNDECPRSTAYGSREAVRRRFEGGCSFGVDRERFERRLAGQFE